MGGEVSLKLPFTLMHSDTDPDLVGFPSPIREPPKQFGRNTDVVAERSAKSDNSHRNKENKLEVVKKQEKESRVTDVDLIEHCEEGDST